VGNIHKKKTKDVFCMVKLHETKKKKPRFSPKKSPYVHGRGQVHSALIQQKRGPFGSEVVPTPGREIEKKKRPLFPKERGPAEQTTGKKMLRILAGGVRTLVGSVVARKKEGRKGFLARKKGKLCVWGEGVFTPREIKRHGGGCPPT